MKPDKTSRTPLYIQIREDIRRDIVAGKMRAGDRLQPVTALAAERGVTPATIRRALLDLAGEGLVSSHVGRGTFVTGGPAAAAPEGTQVPPRNTDHAYTRQDTGLPAKTSPGSGREFSLAGRRVRTSVARSLAGLMNLAQRPGVIAFTRGIVDPDTVENGVLARLAQKALAGGDEPFREPGDPRGLLSLRKAIVRLYSEQGIEVSPGQILVTNGSQQAIALLAQQAAERGATVMCETPCYAGVTNAFSAFGLQIETIPRGDRGPDLSRLPAPANPTDTLLYLCPVLHNPMGTDISAELRDAAAQWARRNGATIVSDEVFRDLHFGEEEAPASFLKDPGPDRAVIIGSLSKSFISGLRVGWLVTSDERVRELTDIKKAMGLGCPPLMQGIAREFLEDREGLAAHRERVTAHYRTLRDAALAALGRHMPEGVTWTRPRGGFQLWVTLPEDYSSVELYLRSIDRGAAFIPGPLQDVQNRFMNSFRLCYGSLTVEEIETGIGRLGAATREYLSESPRETGMSGLGDF